MASELCKNKANNISNAYNTEDSYPSLEFTNWLYYHDKGGEEHVVLTTWNSLLASSDFAGTVKVSSTRLPEGTCVVEISHDSATRNYGTRGLDLGTSSYCIAGNGSNTYLQVIRGMFTPIVLLNMASYVDLNVKIHLPKNILFYQGDPAFHACFVVHGEPPSGTAADYFATQVTNDPFSWNSGDPCVNFTYFGPSGKQTVLYTLILA